MTLDETESTNFVSTDSDNGLTSMAENSETTVITGGTSSPEVPSSLAPTEQSSVFTETFASSIATELTDTSQQNTNAETSSANDVTLTTIYAETESTIYVSTDSDNGLTSMAENSVTTMNTVETSLLNSESSSFDTKEATFFTSIIVSRSTSEAVDTTEQNTNVETSAASDITLKTTHFAAEESTSYWSTNAVSNLTSLREDLSTGAYTQNDVSSSVGGASEMVSTQDALTLTHTLTPSNISEQAVTSEHSTNALTSSANDVTLTEILTKVASTMQVSTNTKNGFTSVEENSVTANFTSESGFTETISSVFSKPRATTSNER